jgi:uncharacterized protein (DUF952 family)
MALIYKICPAALWRDAEDAGLFRGAPVDEQDGYIHFSTAAQARETAAKHFATRDDLLLVAVEAGDLGESLRYEPSRGGDLFPHLYAPLRLSAVRWVKPLPLGPDGRHAFPAEVPGGTP